MLVDPGLLPGGHLDPEASEVAAQKLRQDAADVRAASTRVAHSWQGLGACYEAPETDQVLRALDPVTSGAQRIADNLDQVANALDRFADDVRALLDQRRALGGEMQDLRSQAVGTLGSVTALGGGFGGGVLGVVPPELALQNAALLNRSALLTEEIETVERGCARKIEEIGSPKGWGERTLDWFADVGTGIGDSFAAGGPIDEWFGNLLGGITAGFGQGRRWINETATDFGDWYTDTDTAVDDWVEEVTHLNDWPRTVEVLADQFMEAGQILTSVPFADGGSWLFDDGTPHAGEPVPWDFSLDPARNEVPYSLVGLTGGVDAAYEDARRWEGREQSTKGLVRVTTMQTADGPRVVVSVPGTMEWGPAAGDNPMDLTSDLATMNGSGQSTVAEAVRLAMGKADIPDDAQVMMVGHSLGGITVAHLLEDSEFAQEYNVTHAMTFGSPIDSFEIEPDIHVTQIQHTTDIVPRSDLDDDRVGFGAPAVDRGPNQSKIVLDPPGWFWEGKMSHENYTESMRNNDDPRLDAYEQELRDAGFLLPPPQTQLGPWRGPAVPQVDVEYVPVERKFDQ